MDIFEEKDDYKIERNREWIIHYLQKDEAWYKETIKKIKCIEASLNKNLNEKDKTLKVYGWIAETIHHRHLAVSLENDIDYARAETIKLILTDPDRYLRLKHSRYNCLCEYDYSCRCKPEWDCDCSLRCDCHWKWKEDEDEW